MANQVLDAMDLEIEAALERARNEPEWVRIVAVKYFAEPELDLFVMTLSDGRRLSFPRENLWPLKGSTPEQAADFTIGPHGSHIWWPQMDEGLSVDGLLEGRTGNDKWMERLRRKESAA